MDDNLNNYSFIIIYFSYIYLSTFHSSSWMTDKENDYLFITFIFIFIYYFLFGGERGNFYTQFQYKHYLFSFYVIHFLGWEWWWWGEGCWVEVPLFIHFQLNFDGVFVSTPNLNLHSSECVVLIAVTIWLLEWEGGGGGKRACTNRGRVK